MAKTCTIPLSAIGVRVDLVKAKIVDKNMTIINNDKFEEFAKNIKDEAGDKFDVYEDIVMVENGKAIVNQEAMDNIFRNKYATPIKGVNKPRVHNGTDNTVIRQVVTKVKSLIPGANVRILSTLEIKEEFGEEASKSRGFLTPNNGVVLNVDNYTIDTPFHEYAHLAMKFLKEYNPKEYAIIVSKALEHETYSQIKARYPELSAEELGEEIFVSRVGLQAAHNFTQNKGVADKIKAFYRKFVGHTFGIYSDNIQATDSIESIIKKFSHKILNPASVFHNLPINQINELLTAANKKYSDKAMEEQLEYSGYVKKVAGKKVFLDINYKRSRIYDDAIARGDSEEVAKKKYLRHMSNLVNLRFQKLSKNERQRIKDAVELVQKEHDELKIKDDASGYETTGNIRKEYKRTTSFKERFIDAFVARDVATVNVIKRLKKSKFDLYVAGDTSGDAKEIVEERAKTFAEEQFKKIPKSDIDQLIEDELEMYKFKREEGTFIHQMAEDYIDVRQRLADAQAKDPNATIILKDYTIDKINGRDVAIKDMSLIAGLLATKPRIAYSDEVDANGNKVELKNDNADNGKYSPTNNAQIKEHRTNYLRELEKQLKAFEKGKGRIEYKTEVRLKSDALGYAGSIDLLAFDVDAGIAYVIDHKTKERGKNKKYWWNAKQDNKKMKGKRFGRYYHNAMTDASLQTSMYRLMLEEKGFKTGNSVVFYTEGDVDTSNGPTQYSNISITPEPLLNLKEEILLTFKDDGVSIDNIARNKRNDIYDSFNNIVDNQDIDLFEPDTDYINELYRSTITRKGREGFMWGEKFIAYKQHAISAMQRKEQIRTTLSMKEKLVRLEEDAELLFEKPDAILGGTYDNNGHARKANILRNMRGVSKETHDLIRLSREGDFGENYTGIIMFRNKLTGAHRIVQLVATKHEGYLSFGDKKHTTVFGKYRANHKVDRTVYSDHRYHEDNMLSAKMVRIGMIIAKLKNLDPDFSVEYITATQPLAFVSAENTEHQGTMYDLHTLMRITGKLMEDALAAGDLVGEAKTLAEDPESFLGSTYETDLPAKLLSEMEGYTSFQNGATLQTDLEEYMNDSSIPLHKLVHSLNDFVRLNSLPVNLERTVLRTILHLKGFRTAAITQDISTFEKYLTIPAHSSNIYIQKMGDVARGNKRAARIRYIDYSTDHAKAIDSFMGRSNYVNTFALGTPQEMKDLLLPIDPDKPENMYRFKPDGALNSKQLAYKKFFQKRLRESFELTESGPKLQENIENYINKGYIPLVSTSFREKMLRAANNEDRKDVALRKLYNAGEESTEAQERRFDLQSVFKEELGTDDLQGSASRRAKLGINNEGVIEKERPYETNLEIILDRVVSESLMTHYGRDTLAVGKALAMEQKYQFDNFGHETKELKAVLELVSYVFVKGEMSNSFADKVVGSASTLATYMAIALSAKSMVLETVTNMANITKLFIQEDVMGRLLNTESRFRAGDMFKASKLMTTDAEKANLLMLHFGMKESDPRRLDRFMSVTQKGRLFKEDNFFAVQTAVLSMAQMEVLIASMLHQGAYDAYYVEDGKLKYDETKDARFFPQDGSPRTDKQKAFYEMMKKRLGNEGKIGKDGKMDMGYSDIELNSLKDYTVEAFSSMDDDSRNASTYGLFGRMVGKFKTWVLPRVARIIGSSTEERISNLHWNYIRDKDGKIIKVVPQFDPAEGYLYTLGKLANSVYQDGSLKELKDMSDFEKEQLKKASADFTMVALLMVAYSAITCSDESKAEGTCWHKNSASGAIVYQSLRDAPSDILVPITIWQTLTGNTSMAPSLSIFQRTASRVATASGMIASGDVEEGFMYGLTTITAAKHFVNLVDEAQAKMM
jgi:hypothetical protein